MTTHPVGPDFPINLTIEPLTRASWHKFVQLFGDKGACGNCWCMYFRLPPTKFVEGKADNGNRDAMKQLVWQDKPTGVLGCMKACP